MPLTKLHPPGWPRPRGHTHGWSGKGRLVVLGGQVGCDTDGRFAPGFVAQAEQALRNILAVLAEAGGGPQDVARLTWFVLRLRDYQESLPTLGAAWREVMGAHFPAMTFVQVSGLVEPDALLEIEATAILGEGP
jgi:enamine deaminase RidA (YjgF/YER057c/UK114 family)